MAILVAHRGFRSEAGENRMIDFENALRVCQAVEFDIRLTKDNQVIIFHDNTFKRIANEDIKVNDLTYQEIKALKFFQENPISIPPLLSEFTNKLSKFYQMINVEIKEEPDRLYTETELTIIFAAINQLATNTKAEIIVSSFDLNLLKEINKRINAPIKKGYLFENKEDFNPEFTNFDYIHPWIATALNQEMINKLQTLNKPLNIWTFANNQEAQQIKQTYQNQVYGYISDNPELNWNE